MKYLTRSVQLGHEAVRTRQKSTEGIEVPGKIDSSAIQVGWQEKSESLFL